LEELTRDQTDELRCDLESRRREIQESMVAARSGAKPVDRVSRRCCSHGIEKIEFFWYVRRISFLALIGYIGGAVAYVLLH